MRKLRVSILLTVIALLMLLPMMKPTQQVKAFLQEYTISVYADHCAFGPWPPYGTLIGEWTYDCFSYSGWGASPGGPCKYSETFYGNECQFK